MKAISALLLLAIASPVLAVTITPAGFPPPTTACTPVSPKPLPSTNTFPTTGLASYIGPGRGAPVTIDFASTMDYFGFYFGRLDAYNYVDLYQGNTLMAALTGTQIATIGGFPSNRDQGRGIFVNINTDNDSDNHSLRAVQRSLATVPELSSFLLLSCSLSVKRLPGKPARAILHLGLTNFERT